jgi:hypothetical protein
VNYGEELRFETALHDKSKEIDRFEKLNDREQANKKKLEYESLVNQRKQ